MTEGKGCGANSSFHFPWPSYGEPLTFTRRIPILNVIYNNIALFSLRSHAVVVVVDGESFLIFITHTHTSVPMLLKVLEMSNFGLG